jgi:hypothetical protein
LGKTRTAKGEKIKVNFRQQKMAKNMMFFAIFGFVNVKVASQAYGLKL